MRRLKMMTQTTMVIVYDGLVVVIMLFNLDDNSDYHQRWW
jgi:hypothetical protein